MFFQIVFLLASNLNLFAQTIKIDSLNFHDTLLFEQNINYKGNGQIDFVEYNEIKGITKKIEYYNSKQQIKKEKVWRQILIKEIVYTYLENNQIIKRFDVQNKINLPVQLNINFNYPALARENEIEGVVEIKLDYDENCIPRKYEILNIIDFGIDEEVDKKMKILLKLAKKYSVSFDGCKKSDENFKLYFKLE